MLCDRRTEILAELNLDTGEKRTLGEPFRGLAYADYISENGDLFLLSSGVKNAIKEKNNLETIKQRVITSVGNESGWRSGKMQRDNLVLETAEKLYCTQKEKSVSRGKEGFTRELLSELQMDELCMCLEREGKWLWRYAKDEVPFTKEQWAEQIGKIWKYKKTFPVLYHVRDVYDKREAAVCVLMTAKI